MEECKESIRYTVAMVGFSFCDESVVYCGIILSMYVHADAATEILVLWNCERAYSLKHSSGVVSLCMEHVQFYSK
jgi:hypothetical protein